MTGDVERLLAELDLALLDELAVLRVRTAELQDHVDELAWELVVIERENVRLLEAPAALDARGDRQAEARGDGQR